MPVCPWEVFAEHGMRSIGIGHNCATWVPNVTRMAPKSSPNIIQITAWDIHGQVRSARLQKDVSLVADGEAHGFPKGPLIIVFGIRFCHFLEFFAHSTLHAF